MIRRFTTLCKAILDNLSDEDIFLKATDEFRHHGEKCPCCGAVGKLSPYGGYSRNLVSHKNRITIESRVRPLRFKCASCRATHAILPDILIPYSQYSLRFMLTVLLAYFKRDKTVVAICERFGIAVSTLYAWKERLLKHKELLLGVILNRKQPARTFLQNLFGSADISDRLLYFFNQYAFSFLQNQPIAATCSPPP